MRSTSLVFVALCVAVSPVLAQDGPLILLPLVLLIDPFLRAVFVPELAAAGFYASILIIGNAARMMLPASMSVIVGGGRPGLMAWAGALKLAIDLAIIFSLQAYSPKLLVTGLVVSWVLYINLLYMLARRQLAIRIEPDWLTVLIAGVGICIVWAQLQPVVFIPAWILIGAYAVRRARRMIASVM